MPFPSGDDEFALDAGPEPGFLGLALITEGKESWKPSSMPRVRSAYHQGSETADPKSVIATGHAGLEDGGRLPSPLRLGEDN
jgi:hypothetical protein